MSQLHPRVLVLLLLLLAAACGPRRPDFSPEMAQEQIAEAFQLTAADVSILSDGHALETTIPDVTAEWWVDFRLPSFRETLQARFAGGEDAWSLAGVRRRPRSGDDAPWEDVGVLLGETRAAAAEQASETMEIMRELAGAIEAYAVDAGNVYPETDLSGLARLIGRGGRYLETWRHDTDGWGNQMHYYAAPGGQAYILISRGADNRFDEPLDAYQAKTDNGNFAYEGPTSDPAADLIYAVGSFVQSYQPGE